MISSHRSNGPGQGSFEQDGYFSFLSRPSLTEQRHIVAKLEAHMVLCDRQEFALAHADTTRARLLEALLHEALEPVANAMEAA